MCCKLNVVKLPFVISIVPNIVRIYWRLSSGRQINGHLIDKKVHCIYALLKWLNPDHLLNFSIWFLFVWRTPLIYLINMYMYYCNMKWRHVTYMYLYTYNNCTSKSVLNPLALLPNSNTWYKFMWRLQALEISLLCGIMSVTDSLFEELLHFDFKTLFKIFKWITIFTTCMELYSCAQPRFVTYILFNMLHMYMH